MISLCLTKPLPIYENMQLIDMVSGILTLIRNIVLLNIR
jgi:hypothetical protein